MVDETEAPHRRPGTGDGELGRLSWQQMENRYMRAVLAEHAGNRSRAARAMGISRATLLRKIKTLGLEQVGRP